MQNNSYKNARITSGLRFNESAKKLGITQSYLYYIESGKRMPGRELILKMCELYNCKLEDIFLTKNITFR